jgi:hypothetical protein
MVTGNSLSHVQAAIGCFQKNSIKRASDWKWAKKPVQIIAIHDLQHPAQRRLVNSVLGSQDRLFGLVAHPLLAAAHESVGP